MDILQKLQDDEYAFPYHYVSQFENGFTQCFYDSWGINYVATIQFILSKLKEAPFGNIIDIGCGDGRLVQEIQRAFPGKEIFGIDYSLRAITLARAMNPGGNYRQLNILTQEGEKQYDAGILMEVFEHIPPEDSDAFIRAIVKLLKPGGVLFVTVPHANKPLEYKHYRHFSSQSLSAAFAPYFDIQEVVPFEKGRRRKKIIDFILGNRLFILNYPRLRRILYNYYRNNLFFSPEEKCNRLFLKLALK